MFETAIYMRLVGLHQRGEHCMVLLRDIDDVFFRLDQQLREIREWRRGILAEALQGQLHSRYDDDKSTVDSFWDSSLVLALSVIELGERGVGRCWPE